jgi:hypothetical protein
MGHIPDGLWFFVFLAVAMIGWKIWGARVASALDAFDRRREDADRQMLADQRNPLAHFRRSVEAINDTTAPVLLVKGASGERYATWNGQTFPSAAAAEDARWRHVIAQARTFYQELDEDFGLRVAGPAPHTARDAP